MGLVSAQNKLIMTRGIQGSGKSTWAKDYISKNRGSVRVNNDGLRLVLFDRVFDEKDTKHVDTARENLIEIFLEKRLTVIVDNMNLAEKYEVRYKELAKKHGIEFEIKDFTDVPLSVCIERDKKRENPVGERVIRQTYNKFILKEPPIIQYDPNLPDGIICDLDGTLAKMCDRSPYDEAKSDGDFLNEYVYNALKVLASYMYNGKPGHVILMSGRDEGRGREATERWLLKYNVTYDWLYMRKAGDTRSDAIVKDELYNEHVKGKYNVRAVFDDRLKVCRLWHMLGLPLFRVGDPDADF